MQQLTIWARLVVILGILGIGLIVCRLGIIYRQEIGRLQIFLEEEGRFSEQIGEMVCVIEEIAHQTN